MKYILLFLFLTSSVCSQSIHTLGKDYDIINKLKSEIEQTNSDSIKSFKHLKLGALYFKNYDLDNYRFHLKKGKFFAKHSPFLRVNVKYYESLIYLQNSDFDAFNSSVLRILSELKSHENIVSYELQLIIVQNVSSYFGNKLELDKSIDILIKDGIPLAKKTKNNLMLGAFNQSIANSFFSLGDFEKARSYFVEAIIQMKKITNFGLDVLNSCYIDYVNCLIQLNELEEATRILNKVYSTLAKNVDNNLNPKYYFAAGNLLQMKNQHSEAILQFNKGLIYFSNTAKFDKADLTYGLLVLGLAKSKFKLNDYNGSLRLLDSLIVSDAKQRLIKYELSYQNLMRLGSHQKALGFIEKYSFLKDSLESESKEKEYRMLEVKYNTSEKEKKILQLEGEKKEKEVRLKNLRLWYVLAIVFLVIVVMLSFFLYRNFKIQKKLNLQQELIHSQNIEYLKSKKELELMQAMIDGEESERKRISRDLHDGIGSRLSSLKMQLEQSVNNKNMLFDYDKFYSSLSDTIKDLRQTAFNLVPETLTKLGLELAVKDLCIEMSTGTTKIQFSSNEISSSITPSHQVTIFRVIQELINNALKHSRCTEIIVDCSQNGELFLITVEDNGVGFNTESTNESEGLGLTNIRNRINLLNGKIDIESSPLRGTIFNIEVIVKLIYEK